MKNGAPKMAKQEKREGSRPGLEEGEVFLTNIPVAYITAESAFRKSEINVRGIAVPTSILRLGDPKDAIRQDGGPAYRHRPAFVKKEFIEALGFKCASKDSVF